MARLLAALLPLSHALVAPPTRHRTRHARTVRRAVVDYEVEEGGEARATPLSDDFDGAVQDASSGLLACIGDGALKIRLDFDTSMGDETYTKLKLSTEFARDVAIEWALSLEEDETLVLFFPDAGAAAGARNDWKMDNPDEAEVPPNVRVAAFPRDKLEKGDKAVFALCPRAPERDACEELVNMCADTMRPIALLNPYLVDMGTTGFGMAGRLFKERLVDKLEPCYYLRTLEWGALARTYPRPYTVWRQTGTEESVEGGYAFVKNYNSPPNDEILEELFDEVYEGGPQEDGGVGNLFDEIGKFIDQFQKM